MSNDKIKINISGGKADFGNISQGNSNELLVSTSTETKKLANISCKVFISYRRSDNANISGRIYDRLIHTFGKDNIFKDTYSIPLGVDFKEYIRKEITKSDILLAIIGKGWLGLTKQNNKLNEPLDFVRLEIASAFEKNIPVIPLLVSNASMPEEGDLPDELIKLVYMNGIQIRSGPDFENDINRLLISLNKIASRNSRNTILN